MTRQDIPPDTATSFARVVANYRTTVAVQIDGSDRAEQAYPQRNLPLLVAGDRVECMREDDTLRVTRLVARQSVLERADRRGMKALAANLTHLAVVSAQPPGIDTLLIDQFCIAAYQAGIDALIIINKCDRMSAEERSDARHILDTYCKLGYPTVLMDTKTHGGMDEISDVIKGKTLALVGASGVGKSSIIKRLLPDQTVRIGAVSEATGLGAHTTSVTFWYELDKGGSIIDSPGVRQYSLSHVSEETLRAGYLDLVEAASECRFHNCSHVAEPNCQVKQSVASGAIARWRYDNYCKLLASITA